MEQICFRVVKWGNQEFQENNTLVRKGSSPSHSSTNQLSTSFVIRHLKGRNHSDLFIGAHDCRSGFRWILPAIITRFRRAGALSNGSFVMYVLQISRRFAGMWAMM